MGAQRYHVITGSRLSRRAALRGAALTGLGGAALWMVGCSSSNNNKKGAAATATKAATTAASATSAAPAASAAASAAATRAATSAPAASAAAGSPAASAGSATPKIADFGWVNNAPDLKATPKKGGTLRFGTHVVPPGLDPVKSASYESANIYTPVYSRLIRAQYGTELQPYNPWRLMITNDLAASMEHPDAMTYTFKLKPNVKFQNVDPVKGRAFTADDVKYSLNAFLANPETATYLAAVKVDAVDPQTVKISLTKPANYVLQAMADPRIVMLAHEVADADGDFSKRAIGTGPFILDNFQPNVSAHYKRNPDYYRTDRPYMDAMQFDNFKDNASSKAAFIAGQYEMSQYALLNPLDDIKDILAAQKNTVVFKLQSRWQSNIFAMGFPADKAPWNDQRVRIGISKGWDRSVYGKKAYGGDYNVLGPYAWIDEFDSAPDLGDAYKFDQKAAKDMLSAAGQANLTVPFDYFPYGGDADDQLQTIQNQLKEIGVDLKLNKLDATAFFAKYYGQKADGPISSFIPTTPRWAPLSMLVLWHSGSPKNYLRLSSPEFDAAVDKLTTTEDKDEQKKAYQDAFNKLVQPAFFVSWTESPTYSVHSPKLHGFLPNMYNDPTGWGNQAMEDWWLDT
ncbi:MAG TPA: ABC transporter substrate-binding protein [Dehalococcoidia bacterium]|nr:ABC transporter substrate-binding protein [Dehalococcoidia bacterium]